MNPYLATVLEYVLPLIVSIILVPLLFSLVKFGMKKLNLHLDEATEKKLSDVLTEALTYAEEWARGKIKASAGVKPSGAEKLDAALKYATDEAKRRNLDTWAADALTKKLTAALGLARDPSASVAAPVLPAPVEPPKP